MNSATTLERDKDLVKEIISVHDCECAVMMLSLTVSTYFNENQSWRSPSTGIKVFRYIPFSQGVTLNLFLS